ncbi:hypothetical protein BC940DRAFT_334025 [Gongronella butleri]|nr:hypothetical protein BC940DRAFT_334025 [Gongronella butleri]
MAVFDYVPAALRNVFGVNTPSGSTLTFGQVPTPPPNPSAVASQLGLPFNGSGDLSFAGWNGWVLALIVILLLPVAGFVVNSVVGQILDNLLEPHVVSPGDLLPGAGDWEPTFEAFWAYMWTMAFNDTLNVMGLGQTLCNGAATYTFYFLIFVGIVVWIIVWRSSATIVSAVSVFVAVLVSIVYAVLHYWYLLVTHVLGAMAFIATQLLAVLQSYTMIILTNLFPAPTTPPTPPTPSPSPSPSSASAPIAQGVPAQTQSAESPVIAPETAQVQPENAPAAQTPPALATVTPAPATQSPAAQAPADQGQPAQSQPVEAQSAQVPPVVEPPAEAPPAAIAPDAAANGQAPQTDAPEAEVHEILAPQADDSAVPEVQDLVDLLAEVQAILPDSPPAASPSGSPNQTPPSDASA